MVPKTLPGESAVVTLSKGVGAQVLGLFVVYLGRVTTHFEPPNESRTRTAWNFAVSDQSGVTRNLSYSEGFPGGMTSKPSVKSGYRRYVEFDWGSSSESEIELHLKQVERGPVAGHEMPVALDQLYEFPALSVRISLEKTRPAWTREQIDKMLSTSKVPPEQEELARKTYADAQVKTLRVAAETLEGKKYEFFVDDNYLWQTEAFEVTKGKAPFEILLQMKSSTTPAAELMLTVRP